MISKKIRFEVFKRDSFTCGYCGQKPPSVILEVDHIIPVSEGGIDEINNLITSCFDCNRGKGKNSLEVLPETICEKSRILQEKKDQLKAFENQLKKQRIINNQKCNSINEIYTSYFPKWKLSDLFIRNTMMNFIAKLPITEIEDAMVIACSKMKDDKKAIPYFCGICWNKIKQMGNKNE